MCCVQLTRACAQLFLSGLRLKFSPVLCWKKNVTAQVERSPFDDYHASLLWLFRRRRCRKTEAHISRCAKSGRIGHLNNGRSRCSAFLRKLNSAALIQHTRTHVLKGTDIKTDLEQMWGFFFHFGSALFGFHCAVCLDGCRSGGRRGVAAAWICCHSLYSLLVLPTTEGYLKKSGSSAKKKKYNNDSFPQAETGKNKRVCSIHRQWLCVTPSRADVGKTQSKFIYSFN